QKIPIVREDYLGECIRKNRVLPFDLYKVATTLEESSKGSTVTVKVKGRSAVHEASGLQDTGHILENGKSIYNTTLNISDMTQGVNRSSKRMMGVNAMYFESGDELAVKRLVERNWRRCQKLTQYVNLKDYFWKRLETPGKHGNKKQIFRSSLGDFIHLTLITE
uniref:BRCT domain-containing protein n=1 Tax=Aegilops tauschii subsp. strangulata TaxID=200361 RepID=A0A452XNX4_AEGTS